MKLTVERLPESQVRLEITADGPEMEQAIDRAAKKIANQVQIPGFRKGKAPRSMIERMYGREVFIDEANRSLMDQLYKQAVSEAEIVPVGDPEVSITAADPLAFSLTVAVYPTVDPGDYSAVRAKPVSADVEENAVDEVIERLRERAATWSDPAEPRSPKDGDQVTVDLEMTDENGEQFQDPVEGAVFVLGESQLFDALRAAIESLSIDGTTETTIAFAEDDEDASERLRGKALTYKITLRGVKERHLPEVNDEFAKTYGGEETVEGLKAAILKDLQQSRKTEARGEVLNGIIEKIAEGATLEIPPVMIDDAVTEEVGRVRTRLGYQRMTLEGYLRANNQTEDDLRAELRPAVATRLRNSLVLRAVAEREGIAVDDADLEAEIAEITSAAPDPEQARKIYSGDRYMRSVLRNDLFDKRLSDRLIEIATEGRGAIIGESA